MNADAFSLLNTVLHDRPCIDPSLNTAIETTPFAVLSITQQCYYVLYMVSVTRALLYDDQSAYSQTVQRLVDKIPAEEQKGAVVHPPLPSKCSSSSHVTEPRISVVGGSSATLGQSTETVPFPDSALVSNSPTRPPPSASLLQHTPTFDMPKLNLPPPPEPLELLPVVPACSLDLSIAIVGGGTVVRQLLHLLLDDHPSFIHPTRVTVITRQPEKLNIFATRGVMCLDRKHGTEALNRCHALIIACQPSQLDDFIQTHFSSKPYGNDPLHQVAKLKRSTIVVSCLAAYPKVKLAALLHHDERLVVRTHVAATTVLPEVAEEHVHTGRDCMAVRVQRMADEDSFLKEAVLEAERHRVEEAVNRILDLQYHGGQRNNQIPVDIARRAALHSVLEEDRAKVNPQDPSTRLMESASASYEFLAVVWGAIQAYVASEFEMREGEKARRAQALRAIQLGTNADGRADQDGGGAKPRSRFGSPGIVTQRQGKNEAQSAAKQSEGPFLCAALATLPASRHQAVVQQLISRYRPPTPNAGLFALEKRPSTGKDGGSSVVSFQTTHGPGKGTATTRTVLRRLANVYPEERLFIADLQSHYRQVVEPEPGAQQKII